MPKLIAFTSFDGRTVELQNLTVEDDVVVATPERIKQMLAAEILDRELMTDCEDVVMMVFLHLKLDDGTLVQIEEDDYTTLRKFAV